MEEILYWFVCGEGEEVENSRVREGSVEEIEEIEMEEMVESAEIDEEWEKPRSVWDPSGVVEGRTIESNEVDADGVQSGDEVR